MTVHPLSELTRGRHAALARLGERVLSVDDLKQIIADRKARGGVLPRHDRWAKS